MPAATLLPLLAAAAPPHVVFFLADDLGWNDVSFHGSPQIPTPNIDRLATYGVILDNYYVNPVCSPTRASIMSGRSVMHSGVQTPFGWGEKGSGLNLSYTLLPEQLKKQRNYTNYMLGKWHLGMKSREYLPSARGFDKFYGFYLGIDAWKYYHQAGSGSVGLELSEGGSLLGLPPGGDRPLWNISGRYHSELFADKAVEWIAAHDQRSPMFMYLAFQGIHSSANKFVQAPPEVIARFDGAISPAEDTCPQYSEKCSQAAMRKTVAAEVVVIDESIGRVETALKSAGMWANTLVIFSSDNGGPAYVDANMANNFPLRGGKAEIFEGGIRAAGFIFGAGLQKKKVKSRALHHASDWYKTILAAAGVTTPPALKPDEVPWRRGDGVDNWATLSAGAPSGREELLIAFQAEGSNKEPFGLRAGDMKLMWGPTYGFRNFGWKPPPGLAWNYTDKFTVQCGEPPTNTSGNTCFSETDPCLYNITADPCEYHNLAKQLPDVLADLKARLYSYANTTVLPWTVFSKPDPASDPVNFGPSHPILPDPYGGPTTYDGWWCPWMTAEEAASDYPATYHGPGYPQ